MKGDSIYLPPDTDPKPPCTDVIESRPNSLHSI